MAGRRFVVHERIKDGVSNAAFTLPCKPQNFDERAVQRSDKENATVLLVPRHKGSRAGRGCKPSSAFFLNRVCDCASDTRVIFHCKQRCEGCRGAYALGSRVCNNRFHDAPPRLDVERAVSKREPARYRWILRSAREQSSEWTRFASTGAQQSWTWGLWSRRHAAVYTLTFRRRKGPLSGVALT